MSWTARTATRLGLALATSLLALAAPACDSDGDGDGTQAGTQCELSFTQSNAAGKDFGEACTSDAECQFGECMKPGDTANTTNSVFGFCTRGCDCENNDAARVPADRDSELECLYPTDGAGTFRDYHHVVVRCSEVAECQALAAGWTDCRIPDSGTAQKVCIAE